MQLQLNAIHVHLASNDKSIVHFLYFPIEYTLHLHGLLKQQAPLKQPLNQAPLNQLPLVRRQRRVSPQLGSL